MELNKIVSNHIAEITGAKQVSISRNYSENLTFKAVKGEELREGDMAIPSVLLGRREDGYTCTPFYRIHCMGIVYKENSCDFFEYKSFAINNNGFTYMQEKYKPILENMDRLFSDKYTKFGHRNSPTEKLTSHIFLKDNSFCVYSFNGNQIIKKEFEGKFGYVVSEDDNEIFYSFKDNKVYRYKINKGEISEYVENVGYFNLDDKTLYYTDEKEIEKIEYVRPYDPDFEADSEQYKMRVMKITFTDGTKRVLVKNHKKEETVTDYYKEITDGSRWISLSKREAQKPENAKYEQEKFEYDGGYVAYYIPGLTFNYKDGDSEGKVIIRLDCTQEVIPMVPKVYDADAIRRHAAMLAGDDEESTTENEEPPKQKIKKAPPCPYETIEGMIEAQADGVPLPFEI